MKKVKFKNVIKILESFNIANLPHRLYLLNNKANYYFKVEDYSKVCEILNKPAIRLHRNETLMGWIMRKVGNSPFDSVSITTKSVLPGCISLVESTFLHPVNIINNIDHKKNIINRKDIKAIIVPRSNQLTGRTPCFDEVGRGFKLFGFMEMIIVKTLQKYFTSITTNVTYFNSEIVLDTLHAFRVFDYGKIKRNDLLPGDFLPCVGGGALYNELLKRFDMYLVIRNGDNIFPVTLYKLVQL